MRTIKQVLIILLVLLVAGEVFTYFYQGSLNRTVPPTITCPEGTLEISASDPESVLKTGLTAYDEQDGDLTQQIVMSGISKLISNDTAKATFMVFDSDDNMATCTRYIRYTDYHRPEFTVTEPLVYSSTEEISLLDRIVATDVVDGDISHKVRVSTLEPTNNSEIYNISIQVTNSIGDTVWQQLPVLVLETDLLRPTVILSDYLIHVDQGSAFDPSIYPTDLIVPNGQGSLSDVVIDNGVDTSVADTYHVTYTYTANGRTGTAILTVVVQ